LALSLRQAHRHHLQPFGGCGIARDCPDLDHISIAEINDLASNAVRAASSPTSRSPNCPF
jgi:hypothetical protein